MTKPSQGYIFWPFVLSKLKNREEFEGGLYEKRKGKGGKRRKKKREKEKREKGKKKKGKKGMERDKKMDKVIKGENYLEFVLFPCFWICTIMEENN